MAEARRHRMAECRCGRTKIEIVGEPFLSAICYCGSCQTAGRQFELVPGAVSALRADGGTEYCLFRKDRLKIVQGGDHLRERRLTPESATRRVVALCCNSPMFLDFTKGHWLTLYRNRLPGEAPRLQMRVMARDAPAGLCFTDDIPTFQRYPRTFLTKLMAAWATMGFQRPKITWQE